jgi:uncharacterized damage-inducible protein DinB
MLKFRKIPFFLGSILVLIFVIESTPSANPPSEPVFVQEYIGQTDFIEGRLSQMLGAMSQTQMSWTPAEGVRTCSQIYLHVAEVNHMLAGFMSGAEIEGEPGTMEKKTTDKDEIAKMLKDSFAAVKEVAGKLTEEDLNKMVQTPFGMEMSMRNFMISLLAHSHEHLGQGIAYARMNGVTPPWNKKDSEG